jgi:hypothetical protein
MKRRTTLIRFLALVWATLQLASPGLASIADGMLARESASSPSTHVETTTSASCPVVHSPDCAVCRYLSASGSNAPAAAAFSWKAASQCRVIADATTIALSTAVALPHGRAPPIL